MFHNFDYGKLREKNKTISWRYSMKKETIFM